MEKGGQEGGRGRYGDRAVGGRATTGLVKKADAMKKREEMCRQVEKGPP